MGHAGGQAAHARKLLRADELALGVQQVVGHPVQALGKHREIPGFGIGRARGEVAGGHRIGDRHQPAHGAQDVPRDEVAPEDDEGPDVERDDHQNEQDGLPRGQIGGEGLHGEEAAHTEQQGGAGKERQVGQQLGAERGLTGHNGHTSLRPTETCAGRCRRGRRRPSGRLASGTGGAAP